MDDYFGMDIPLDPTFSTTKRTRSQLESSDQGRCVRPCLDESVQNYTNSEELKKRSSTDDLLSNIENNLNYVNYVISLDDPFKLKSQRNSPEKISEETSDAASNIYHELNILKAKLSKITGDQISSRNSNIVDTSNIMELKDDSDSEAKSVMSDVQRSIIEDDADSNEISNIISKAPSSPEISYWEANEKRNKKFGSPTFSFQKSSSPEISDWEDDNSEKGGDFEKDGNSEKEIWDVMYPDVSQDLNSSKQTKAARAASRKKNKKKRTTLSRKLGKLQKELIAKQRECNKKRTPRYKRKQLEWIIDEKEREIESVRLELQKISEIKTSSSDDEDYEENKHFGFGDDFENLLHEVFEGEAATVQGLENLKDTLSRCPVEDEMAPDPEGLLVPLMLHQKRALNWMLYREKEKHSSGLLADDMGLGKTLTMISLILQTLPPRRVISRRTTIETDVDSDDSWDEKPAIKDTKDDSQKPWYEGGGTLVVCPLSLLEQWQNEVTKRIRRGLITVKIYHGSKRERDPRELLKFDMVITTYHILAKEYESETTLFRIHWKRVVLDEAHIVRNPETTWLKAACALRSEKRWALTGTPVHNKPLDLYSLLKFLKCSPWDDIKVWRSTLREGRDGVKPLITILKSLVKRRTKKELQEKGEMPSLPPKTMKEIEIELEEPQAEVYKTMLRFSRSMFEKFLLQRKRKAGIHDYDAEKRVHEAFKNNDPKLCNKDDLPADLFKELNKALLNGGEVKQFHILVLLLRLRQICNHPALLNKMIAEHEIQQRGNTGEEETSIRKGKIFNGSLLSMNKDTPMRSDNPVFRPRYKSAKIQAIFEILDEVLPTGDKIVIVSQWTSMLKIIEEHLMVKKEAEWEIFSGEVDVDDRQGIVDRFNDPESDLKILLLSLTAGGVGLNLFGGNHLILFDNHWNPQLENQAQDRIYRYGQTKEVTIYRFLCKETVEERVKELQDEKLKLAKEIFTGLKLTSTRLTLADLKRLFQMC